MRPLVRSGICPLNEGFGKSKITEKRRNIAGVCQHKGKKQDCFDIFIAPKSKSERYHGRYIALNLWYFPLFF